MLNFEIWPKVKGISFFKKFIRRFLVLCESDYFYLNFFKAITCNSTSMICQNGGTCLDTDSNQIIGFECLCLPGYYGPFCQLSKLN